MVNDAIFTISAVFLMSSLTILQLQYLSFVLTYRDVTTHFGNCRNRRLRLIMIGSHVSFQESHLKVVKPKTKRDIFKFPPFTNFRLQLLEFFLICMEFVYISVSDITKRKESSHNSMLMVQIDRKCRFIFPLLFMVVKIVYWYYYVKFQ